VSYLREAEGKIDSQFMAEIHSDEGYFFQGYTATERKEKCFLMRIVIISQLPVCINKTC
jgi:hypothetical protein